MFTLKVVKYFELAVSKLVKKLDIGKKACPQVNYPFLTQEKKNQAKLMHKIKRGHFQITTVCIQAPSLSLVYQAKATDLFA